MKNLFLLFTAMVLLTSCYKDGEYKNITIKAKPNKFMIVSANSFTNSPLLVGQVVKFTQDSIINQHNTGIVLKGLQINISEDSSSIIVNAPNIYFLIQKAY